jgi:hypothetical protein
MSEENAKMITDALRSVVTPGEAIPLGEAIERLLERARAEEREACAKVCDEIATRARDDGDLAEDCAAQIRARGER